MSLTPNPNFAQLSQTAKSFWDRKEGSFARYVLIAAALGLGAAALFFWGLILPFLIGVIGNSIQLAGLIGVLGLITSPIWSNRVRLLVSNAFQLSMRWTYQALIEKDPIGMLRNNVDMMRKEAAEFDRGVSQLAGSKQRLETDIETQKQSIQRDKNLTDAVIFKINHLNAQNKQGLSANERQDLALRLQQLELGRQGYLATAGIAMQTIQAEQPILDQTNRMYEQLCRLRNLATFKVESLSQQADMYAKQRATILASQKALGAAGRILKGDPQQLAVVEQTIEYLNQETATTIGAMKDFNRNSEKYLTDMDIQNEASAAGAQKLFDQLEQKLSLPDPLTGQSPAALLSPVANPIQETAQDAQGTYVPTSDYSQFLK